MIANRLGKRKPDDRDTAAGAAQVPAAPPFTHDEIVAGGKVMLDLLAIVQKVGPTNTTVLVRGETGTGKELIVRALHASSLRSARPPVVVNCAAVPDGLWESELFGHERGALTGAGQRRIGRFEQANGGTLVLDEVGQIPLTAQAMLLRVLDGHGFSRIGGNQTLHTDVRVLATTSCSLEDGMTRRTFREDLFYRLTMCRMLLPPLRERTGDVPLLLAQFLRRHAAALGCDVPTIDDEAVRLLGEYPWPGNVRQLVHCVQRMLIVAAGRALVADDVRDILAEQYDAPPPASVVIAPGEAGASAAGDELHRYIERHMVSSRPGEIFDICIRAMERRLLEEATRIAEGNQSKACRVLGISRPTFRDKLAKHGLLKRNGLAPLRKPR